MDFINNIQKQNDCCCIQKPGWCLIFLGILGSVAFFMNIGIGTNLFSNALNSIEQNDAKAIIDGAKFCNKNQDHTTPDTSSHTCSTYFKKRHFLATTYYGRTGNLLFKFATLIATAKLTCYTAVRTPGYITYLDKIFDLKGLPKMRNNLASFKKLREPGWGIYDANITSRITPDFNWTLSGCRQSFRYFQKHADLIRSSFSFKDSIKKDVYQFLNSATLSGSIKVCLHVRRSDGLNSKDRKNGNHISELAYIKHAIEYMKTHVQANNLTFLVASDDIKWCETNIKGGHVRYSPFKDSGRDLYLLTQCNHNILTTGTFGWMGAWLNETGVVIYDKLFPFPNSKLYKGHKPADYYPRHWIGL